MSVNEDARRLALAIVNFLQTELSSRPDISLQDRDSVEIAIECLQSVYALNELAPTERRPLLDMYQQVANPVSVKDKQRADALKDAGNSKMVNQQFQEAEQDYSQAIELDKWNSVYYCNRAGARLRLEQYYEALSDCRQAVLLNPDYAKAYGRMGQAYARMDSHRRAARCFRKALELEPDDETYRRNLMVAERRAAEDPASIMGPLIQGLLSSILGGGGGRIPFVIMSDPHRAEDCESGHVHNQDGGESSLDPQAEQTSSSGGSEDSSRDSDEEAIHVRVLFGIPMGSETDQESGDGFNPVQPTGSTNETESDPEEECRDSIENQEEKHQVNGSLEEQKEEKEKSNYQGAAEQEDPNKTIAGSIILNPTSDNGQASTPVAFKTANVQDTDTNEVIGADEEISNENGTQGAEKDAQDGNNPLPEVAKESPRDETRENKPPIFSLSDVSNFFKNFGRSTSSTESNLSNTRDDKKEKEGDKEVTDEVSNVPEDKQNKPTDGSKNSQGK